jgi:histidine ammonia-lyase
MAPIAARKAYTILKNTEYILAIELWCAVVALRIRIMEGLTPGPNAIRIMALLEKTIPKFSEDRVTYDEIEDIKQMIHEGKIPV